MSSNGQGIEEERRGEGRREGRRREGKGEGRREEGRTGEKNLNHNDWSKFWTKF